MSAPAGNQVGLNLGPRHAGPSARVPLNLGVPWDGDGPPDPPEPVIRGIRRACNLEWRSVALRAARTVAPAWAPSPVLRRATAVDWRGSAARAERAIALQWASPERLEAGVALAWRGAMLQLHASSHSAWASLPVVSRSAEMRWEVLPLLHGQAPRIAWAAPPMTRRSARMTWHARLPRRNREFDLAWRNPGVTLVQRDYPWGVARRVPWVVVPRPPKPPPPQPPGPNPDGRYIALDLGCSTLGIAGFAPLNLGITACYAVRPHRRTYVLINDVQVVRLPDRTPIGAEDVDIASSVDAWAHSLDMTLADPSHLALLKPTAQGPREVEVTVNGAVYTFVVENYSGAREFGGRTVRVSGRSRTALLAAPYAPARTHVSTLQRSAAQLVDDELQDTGFTAVYDTVDWLVPAGAWFYDATPPLDAIARVAESSGAVVQSHPEDRELRVRARYPHSPWAWRDVAPDHIIVDDLILNESLQVRSAPLYNAVVVTGELQGKGVTATVRRAGEGGDLYAPQASGPLVNTEAVAIERGRNVLSDRGEQAAIEITVPLFAAPLHEGQVGRVLPLDLVEVHTVDGAWHGLCVAARVQVRREDKALVVEQTLTLERHYTDAD